MSTINERIAQCIAITGLTKTAFAQKINLSQPHMSKIALGHSAPTDRTIADICREFNVNETWIRTGKGKMFNTTPDTLEDKLAQEYGLDDLGRQIMSAYLKLGESDRLAVGRLIQNILDERTPAPAQPEADKGGQEQPRYHVPMDEEIEREVEDFRRRLLLEKRQPDGSSPLSADGAKMA